MERWSHTKANAWYRSIRLPIGCNFIPSTAVNDVAMWQADTFDRATIDRELGWAAGLGMNSVRVFINYVVWEADASRLKRVFEQFLEISHVHGLSVVPTLFDDCNFAGLEAKAGVQPEPVPGVHNSGWVSSPPRRMVSDEGAWGSLGAYIGDMVRTYRTDTRILFWDLYNEPGHGQGERSLPLLKSTFEWARAEAPQQPLTAGTWSDNAIFNAFQYEASDIITFHDYHEASVLARHITDLKKLGRPVLCTEWMRRGVSDIDACLPVFMDMNVGCYLWGLVAGKTQTIFPWGSPEGAEEPAIWFHDLLRNDGTPFDERETALFRSYGNRV